MHKTILIEHSKGTEFKWKTFTYAVYFVRFMLFFYRLKIFSFYFWIRKHLSVSRRGRVEFQSKINLNHIDGRGVRSHWYVYEMHRIFLIHSGNECVI